MNQTKIIVQVSDAQVSNDPGGVIVTYSLGSCIGVCLWEPKLHVGGMLHYQLPEAKLHPDRAREHPFMFADTGMDRLLKQMGNLGCQTRQLKAWIAGGAEMHTGPKGFDIGKRNRLAIQKILWRHGMFIEGEDVGGHVARHLSLDIDTGLVTVRSQGVAKTL